MSEQQRTHVLDWAVRMAAWQFTVPPKGVLPKKATRYRVRGITRKEVQQALRGGQVRDVATNEEKPAKQGIFDELFAGEQA